MRRYILIFAICFLVLSTSAGAFQGVSTHRVHVKENLPALFKKNCDLPTLSNRQGVSILKFDPQNYLSDGGIVEFPLTESEIFSTDYAVAFKENLKAPSDSSTFIYSLSSNGKIVSKVEWKYKILAEDYVRLTRRIDDGVGINVYDGEPLSHLQLDSIFLLAPVLKDTQKLTLNIDRNGKQEMREFSVQQPTFSLKNSDPSLNTPTFSPTCSNYAFRITTLKDGAICNVMHGESATPSLKWNQMTFGQLPAEPAKYTVRTELTGYRAGEPINFIPQEHEVKLEPYPRFIVLDGMGNTIADSRTTDKKVHPDYLHLKLASGAKFASLPESYGYGLNRIYMKKNRLEDYFTIIYFPPKMEHAPSLYLTSDIRDKIMIPLNKCEDGTYSGRLLLTDKPKSPVGSLVLGNGRVHGYAFLDVTYDEDTQAFTSIMQANHWQSRGAIYPDDLNMPDKKLFLKDFLRSGGFEKLHFVLNHGECKLNANLMIKNQAEIFYYSGHGWGDGTIYTGASHIHPASDMEIGDWSDGMKIAIFSSCSVFDIMNLSNRSFTHIGNYTISPGEYWYNVAGPDVALLGYNWSTFEGKPPNAFDTRVIRSFLAKYFAGAPPVDSWFKANGENKEKLAACSICDNKYYYIFSGAIRALPRSNWQTFRNN